MKRGKISSQPIKNPKMVESSLKVNRYADGGEIEREEELDKQVAAEQRDEHSESGMERDDQHVHPEEDEDEDTILMAEGGSVQDEEDMEEDASMAASIMSKRRMARGGKILSKDALESDDSDQADLSRNADEDQNLEDQASFEALMKENYNESEGLDELDQPDDSNLIGDDIDADEHDMVSSIRKKIKRSPISR